MTDRGERAGAELRLVVAAGPPRPVFRATTMMDVFSKPMPAALLSRAGRLISTSGAYLSRRAAIAKAKK